MRVGYPCGVLYLLLRGVVNAERYVVAETVVKQYGLLVYVAYERAQVVQSHVLHVHSVDEHLALLHVVVARYEVYECRLAAAALAYERHGLALLDGEVDVAQNPLLVVLERHVAELYLALEVGYVHRMLRLLDVALGHEYLVHALHRGETLGYVVARLREFFQRIDDAVEYNEIVDERGAAQSHVV